MKTFEEIHESGVATYNDYMGALDLPKLVILHGWVLDSDIELKWQPFMNKLKGQGIDVRLLSLPGLTSPLDRPWQLNDYVEWLNQQLEDQKKIILLGHSFGGQIAIRFAVTHPQKVRSLILIDSAGIIDRALIKRLKRSVFKSIAQAGKFIFGNNHKLRQFLYKVTREGDYIEAGAYLAKTMQNVINDEVIHDLHKIKCLTLIVWGSYDKVTPLKQAKFLEQKIADSQLKIIKNARHAPQFTHMEEVLGEVTQFILQ